MWDFLLRKMKIPCIGLCVLFCGIVSIAAFPEPLTNAPKHELLGSKMCTWGPSFWCKNITNAKSCGAVKHCIQTVWEHQTLQPDPDSVCEICKNMVAQARAQLESNETQDELRQVFEGSCKLIPLKVISNECIKLADEFIPELVETLTSQMNPQVVCAVAGLCNNERIDYLLLHGEEDEEEDLDREDRLSGVDLLQNECAGCNRIAKQMVKKFHATPRGVVFTNLLEVCGRFGSFSDGCSEIIISHFDSLYDHLQKNFESKGLCHLAGVCQHKFHVHNEKNNIEVIHESSVGIVKPTQDDLPCELCEQLVLHLKDILVANTTESEFEEVLQGVCKQFKGFKDQCLSMVNEYYAVIYDFLVNSLRPKEVCSMAGICPQPGKVQGPIWPLVPPETAKIFNQRKDVLVGRDEVNSYHPVLHRVSLGDKGVGVRVNQDVGAPLPDVRMMPQTITYVANKEVCEFCEYFLHYLQTALTTPSTEEKIKEVIDKACDHLPATINDQCRSFVDTYGNALVALLAQEIDPSQVCPELSLCPQAKVMLDVSHPVEDKPTCPLCLFAVEELVSKLQDNKTESEIKEALDGLCNNLPKSLAPECRDFVESYSDELVDMLIADFTPQEVCTYLKMCDAPSQIVSYEIMTNDILQDPYERPVPQTIIQQELAKAKKDTTSCVICEFVMSRLDSALKDKKTDAEIKLLVHDVCNYMPKTVMKECNQFVDQYADLVITLLAQSLDPKEVCTEIQLCKAKSALQEAASLEECAVCDAAIAALDQLLIDPTIEKDIARALQKVCVLLPTNDIEQCKSMIKIYGPSIINLLAKQTEPQLICGEIGMCLRNRQLVNLLGGKKCTWGPGYWCQSERHANSCGALAHCQERVWMADKPKVIV